MRIYWLLACSVATTALTACSGSDAASEAPVALTPGYYQIAIGAGSGEKVCLSARDDEGKINTLIRKQFALYDDCKLEQVERAGNAIGGKLSCRIDAEAGQNVTYTGQVAAEGVKIDATMTSFGPTESVDTGIAFKATRTGDCG